MRKLVSVLFLANGRMATEQVRHVLYMPGWMSVLLRPERSEGLHFFNAALDRGYAQFGLSGLKWSYFLSDWDETWVDLS